MEYQEVVEAIKDAHTAISVNREAEIKTMIPVEPFVAEDVDGVELKIVGVAIDSEFDLKFVAIKTLEDGETYPVLEDSVWPAGQMKSFLE